MNTAFDYARLRGLLAERRISHQEFAAACGLGRAYMSRLLCGQQPGELAQMKIERGMAALGLRLDREPVNA